MSPSFSAEKYSEHLTSRKEDGGKADTALRGCLKSVFPPLAKGEQGYLGDFHMRSDRQTTFFRQPLRQGRRESPPSLET
jgi:hypothetical protein